MPVAIVTGSSRGIGKATAIRFAEDGYDVTVNYVSNDEAAAETVEAVQAHGQEAIAVCADLSDYEGATRLVDETVSTFGELDHVVNNAGIDQHVYTEHLDPADFARIMAVNVHSAFGVTKAALKHLRQSNDDPSVTNISSILAHTGAAIECHYAASKGALLSLTRSHARDFAPVIRVNAVTPGHTDTDMTGNRTPEERAEECEQIPLNRYGQPAEIADAIAYLRDATYVTGETLNVNGGELMC